MARSTTQTAPRFALEGATGRPITWQLHVLASPDRRLLGDVVQLGPGTTLLGRGPTSSEPGGHALAIEDGTLSRSHAACVVRPRAEGLEVCDLGSRNGTWLDGRRIDGRAAAAHGSVLRVGATVCIVEVDDGRWPGHAAPTVAVPGRSLAARRTRSEVAAAARDARPVLITGATGTGKEYVAGEVHAQSRRAGALVRMNVAAVPEALFEAELFGHVRGAYSGALEARVGRVREADGGTLVLDEIGELALSLQPKLLRVLEEPLVRPVGGRADVGVDVKFVASTNADLDARIEAGMFRQDLAARLRNHSISMASLGQRRADLLALADVVVPGPAGVPWAQLLAPDAVELLALHEWPDNLRELARVFEPLRALPPPIGLDALPAPIILAVQRRVHSLPVPAEATRPQPAPAAALLRSLLAEHKGNVEAVARVLSRDRKQVYRWLAGAGIRPADLAGWRQD